MIKDNNRLKQQRDYLILVIVTFAVLCTAFILINPIFEANDESGHLQYAFYIAKYNRLPSVYDEPVWMEKYIEENIDSTPSEVFYMNEKYAFFLFPEQTYYSEAHHPPLYYLISSLVLKPFSKNELYAESNWPYSQKSFDYNVHRNNKLWSNPSPTHLMTVVLRFVQLLYGVISIYIIYLMVRLITGKGVDRYTVLLLSGIALLPQFIFLFSYVNNDALSYLFGLLTVYLILLMFKRNRFYFGILAILLASLAMLTKFTMLIIVPISILTFLAWSIATKRKALYIIISGLIVSSLLAVLVSMRQNEEFFIFVQKNIVDRSVEVFTVHMADFSWNEWKSILPRSFKSAIAYFGWFTIEAADFIYIFYLAYVACGIILIINGIKRFKGRGPALIFLAVNAVLVYSYFLLYAPTGNIAGRIFFLAVMIVFMLAILGFNTMKDPTRIILSYIFYGFPIFINIFCLYYHIYLNYY